MSDQTDNWPEETLGELFDLARRPITPSSFPKEEFVHYSIPAWDAKRGPAVELGASIGSAKTAVTQPTILVSKLNPRIPRVALVESASGLRHCASTEWIPYVAKSDSIVLQFYKWFFKSHIFQRRLEQIATGSTNSHKRASPGETLRWSIPAPLPDDQKHIAAVLDTLDEVIGKTEAVIAKLKQVRTGLFHDLLTRGLDDGGQLRDPLAHPGQFQDSPLGRIPKEWDVATLVSRISLPQGQVNPRVAPYSDWTLVAPDHVESETGRLLTRRTARQQDAISGKYVFQAGDVVYSKIRPYLRKAVLATERGLCSADMYPLRPSVAVNSRFLLTVVLGESFSRFASAVSMRSGFPKLNRDELAEFTMGWPKRDEQDRIATVLIASDNEQSSVERELSKLRQLRSGLMADLLTGRVRVTETITTMNI